MDSFGYGMGGTDVMFSIIPTLVIIGFVVVLGAFVVIFVRGIGEWHQNNQSPQLTVDAEIVAKRADVSHHTDAGDSGMAHSSTSYYVTFQVESGDRMEFHVSGSEYGLLVEGDKGRLSFQGTRYQGFERSRTD